jgi:hypothetical protein
MKSLSVNNLTVESRPYHLANEKQSLEDIHSGASVTASIRRRTRRQIMKKIVGPLLAAAVFTTTSPAHAQQLFKTFALDFVLQGVCVDSQGKVLSGHSPLEPKGTCPTIRKIGAGEAIPYHKHDWANDNLKDRLVAGLQRTDSFPVVVNGIELVVSQYDFGIPPRKFGRFDPGEGGQILHVGTDTASAIITQDSKGLKFFYGPRCHGRPTLSSLEDSWLLFDKSIQDHPTGHATVKIAQSLDASQCPTRLATSMTTWTMHNVRYRLDAEHRRTAPIQTIITDHFSRDQIDTSGSMERMYFTRELGWTRWERWQNLSISSQKSDSYREREARVARSGRCDPRDGAPSGSGNWIMVDCREWTNIQPPDNPAGDAPMFWIKDAASHEPLSSILTTQQSEQQ